MTFGSLNVLDKKMHSIPYIEDVVKAVDIEAKQVTIQVLEGLL